MAQTIDELSMNELLLELVFILSKEIGGIYVVRGNVRTHEKLSRKCLRESIEVVPRTRHESKKYILFIAASLLRVKYGLE